MIKSKKHLLSILKIDAARLDHILDHVEEYYISFERQKIDKTTGQPKTDKDGNVKNRKINAPVTELKKLQANIRDYLNTIVTLPAYFYGGVKKKDNIQNARFHQGNRYFFTTDLKDFFPSISYKKVYDALIQIGFAPDIARIVTRLTTRGHGLPQGVPTSTLLANLVFKPTGEKINAIAEAHKIRFTIFVDDVTLSSKRDFKPLTFQILDLLRQDGFKISHKKTHYQTRRPNVTGLEVHPRGLKCPAMLHRILKNATPEEMLTPRLRGIKSYVDRAEKRKKD